MRKPKSLDNIKLLRKSNWKEKMREKERRKRMELGDISVQKVCGDKNNSEDKEERLNITPRLNPSKLYYSRILYI